MIYKMHVISLSDLLIGRLSTFSKYYCPVLLFFLCSLPESAYAQFNLTRFEQVINQGGVQVDMYYEKPKIVCANKSWKYKIEVVSKPSSFYQGGPYLSWKFKTIDCDDYIVENCVSIDLRTFTVGDKIGDNDWSFDAKSLEPGIYDVKLLSAHSNDKTRRIAKVEQLVEPKSVSGNRAVNSEEQLTLTVEGGKIPPSGRWAWYRDNCGNSQPVYVGQVYSFKPGRSGSYFVRGESQGRVTQCYRVDVLVNDESTMPAGVQVIDNLGVICEGKTSQPRRLRVQGGSLGLRSNWVWYKDVVSNGTRVGTGEVLEVKPERSARFYVRAEGPLGKTDSVYIDVEVVPKPIKPARIDITPSAGYYCAGKPIRLTVDTAGIGSQPGLTWEWSVTRSSGRTQRYYGRSIIDNPVENTTYSVVGTNQCGRTEAVMAPPIRTVDTTVRPAAIGMNVGKNKSKAELSIIGGVPGYNAEWYWYGDPDLTSRIGTGPTVSVRRNKDRRVFLVGKGECNATAPLETYVSKVKRVKSPFVNVGVIGTALGYDPNRVYDFFASVGFGNIYIKGTFSIPSLNNEMAATLSGPIFETDDTRVINYPSNSDSYYEFTSEYYPRLRTYTIGYYTGSGAFNIYAGLGYGSYDLMWGVRRFSYSSGQQIGLDAARNVNHSVTGPSVEGGLLLKLKPFNIMVGSNLIIPLESKSMYISGHLGVGLSF
jgi:hypothetical protein